MRYADLSPISRALERHALAAVTKRERRAARRAVRALKAKAVEILPWKHFGPDADPDEVARHQAAWEAELWLDLRREKAATLREQVEARVRLGFQWEGGGFGGSSTARPTQQGRVEGTPYHRDAFVYAGFVSNERKVLKLFLQATPRAGRSARPEDGPTAPSRRLLTGETKDRVTEWDHGLKCVALDEPYIGWNKSMRSVLRVELDGVWPDETALRADLYDCLGAERLPDVIVCYTDADGRVHGPHLYWVIGEAVNFGENGTKRPQAIWYGVLRGLVDALLPIGADPGCLSNPCHGKNPLSPLWDRIFMRSDDAPVRNLAFLGQGLRTGVSAGELHVRAVERAEPTVERLGGGRQPSNVFFRDMTDFAASVVADYKAVDSYGEFVAAVVLEAAARATTRGERAARAVGYSVADYIWTHFDPSKRQAAKRRGRDWAECQGEDEVGRRRIAGRNSRAQVRAANVEALAAAVLACLAEGVAPTQAEAARRVGVTRQTACANWEAVEAAVRAARPGAPAGVSNTVYVKRDAAGLAVANEQGSTSTQEVSSPRLAVRRTPRAAQPCRPVARPAAPCVVPQSPAVPAPIVVRLADPPTPGAGAWAWEWSEDGPEAAAPTAGAHFDDDEIERIAAQTSALRAAAADASQADVPW